MNNFLAGQNAIVTGGSRGIGRAIAEALLRAGASVAICGRKPGDVEQAVAEMSRTGKVVGQAVDVGNSADVFRFFQFVDGALGDVRILINNAGVGVFRSVADLSVEEWDNVIATNLSGVFYCSRQALQRFKRHGGGYIVNISSLAGKNPFAGGAAYNASKFGLNGLSETSMLDHRNDGVRVSYIMPGSVDTSFNAETAPASWKIAPEDIAEIVIMLLRMPARTTVSRVEVRPSQPRK